MRILFVLISAINQPRDGSSLLYFGIYFLTNSWKLGNFFSVVVLMVCCLVPPPVGRKTADASSKKRDGGYSFLSLFCPLVADRHTRTRAVLPRFRRGWVSSALPCVLVTTTRFSPTRRRTMFQCSCPLSRRIFHFFRDRNFSSFVVLKLAALYSLAHCRLSVFSSSL